MTPERVGLGVLPSLFALSIGCAAAHDPLVEEPRGVIRFESPRRLPAVSRNRPPPARRDDPRVDEAGRLRAVGRAGYVLLLRVDRDPPAAAARVDVGDAAVTALAFGSGASARHLYVALDDRRLLTVDLEAADGPSVADTLVTRDAADLAADGEQLVLLTDEPRRRVLRFDLIVPGRPRLDGSIDAGGAAGAALADGLLVLFDGGGAARAYRLAGGASPTGTTTVHQSVNQ